MQMAATKEEPRILILLLCAILVLFLSTANAIRSLPTDQNHILNESGILTEKSRNLPTGSLKTEKQMNDLEEICNNVEEEEECLMRRTLAAHVDYIYTQEHKRP